MSTHANGGRRKRSGEVVGGEISLIRAETEQLLGISEATAR
jgi:hypothetical protein